MFVAILVKNRASKDEGSEHAKLNGFVEPVPDAVDSEADVKESGIEPGEPYQREELEVVDQRWVMSAIIAKRNEYSRASHCASVC